MWIYVLLAARVSALPTLAPTSASTLVPTSVCDTLKARCAQSLAQRTASGTLSVKAFVLEGLVGIAAEDAE